MAQGDWCDASVTLITAFSLVLGDASKGELAGDARVFVALVFPKAEFNGEAAIASGGAQLGE